MRCHLQCKGCQAYAECGDINTEVFDVILSGYFVKNLGDMMSQMYWMQFLQEVAVMSSIGWCDDTDTVDVRSDTEDLMSYIKWCDVLKSGYDVIERRSDVMNAVYVMS